jgi:hypothetical protein
MIQKFGILFSCTATFDANNDRESTTNTCTIGPQQNGVGFDSHRVYTTNLKYISFSFATDAAKATAHRDIQSHGINQQRLWQYNTSPSSSARYR